MIAIDSPEEEDLFGRQYRLHAPSTAFEAHLVGRGFLQGLLVSSLLVCGWRCCQAGWIATLNRILVVEVCP